jgi:6-pyruvoyltetrahydropterin/6-carboxytetrahydropterin synthase
MTDRVSLTREVRFAHSLHGELWEDAPRHNTFAGWPPLLGPGVWCVLVVSCSGAIEPDTGYLMNISRVDDAVRRCAPPVLQQFFDPRTRVPLASTLRRLIDELDRLLGGFVSAVQWKTTPYQRWTMAKADPRQLLFEEDFEFAAAHRLHCPTISDEQNRRIFGKCNSVNGHGHNYRVRPAIRVSVNDDGSTTPTLADIQRTVHERLIQRFDHRHLNLDVPEFRTLNPSVENITRVCFQLLEPAIASAGGRLDRVTVWETEKTSCTYPADSPA